MVVAAVAGELPVALQAAGLKDDRICMQIDKFKAMVSNQIDKVFNSNPGVWRLLARIVSDSYDPAEVQTESILSTMIFGAYLEYRSFEEYDMDAWPICRGDIPSLLRDVQCGDEPQSPVLRRLWHMTQPDINYHPLLILDMLRNMQCTSGISRRSEKYHAAMKLGQKRHEQAGQDILQCRGLFTKAHHHSSI